ncbi:glutathione S-transferase family protein [Alphaproteobacteria bacterium KMM 3653]|uniref:Glutathione S-transferase family protein n=1 Tax=Harenicola maris TaxID=2841044 RepID=A0AAP2G972_9RHOB|nr:glutathione S-transferase family protein [Harenicola maris]
MPRIEPADQSLKSLSGLHLWHAPLSSCSQRVRITLAEADKSFESHLVNLEKGEHATAQYQAIHPKGVVPALVDNGELFIESIDIIGHLSAKIAPELLTEEGQDLLDLADASQVDLKLLTFEFLFRGGERQSDSEAAAFQANHKNAQLRQFYLDFAAGFAPERVKAAVQRTMDGFRKLDGILADGRSYLGGESFTLADVAWMPNVHRFSLMGWPFDRTPHLAQWFARVSNRPSYQSALVDWQPEEVVGAFAAYTKQRQDEGTDVTAFLS